jgi:hypothetical protein
VAERRGRGLAAANLGFERCGGWGGHGGRRTHGSPGRRVKMETGKIDGPRGWGRGGADARTIEKKTYQFFLVTSFFLGVEIWLKLNSDVIFPESMEVISFITCVVGVCIW